MFRFLAGPPAYLLFANTVDIREINADGTWSRKLLEDPRGDIIALDYDPVNKRILDGLSLLEQENCVSLTCDVNAECVLLQGRAVCQCARGFTAEGEFCVDIDECSEFHNCDVNAACLNAMGSYHCLCRSGFTGTGFSCQEEFDGASSRPSTGTPHDVTSPGQHSKDIQSCPSTYDSYCLYDGVCFYFPEMESYACKQVCCVLGYMGERCQFSDLEWWELQQAEEGERRNMLISVGVVLLVSSLSLAACLSYCCGSKRHLNVCASDDYVGEITVSEYSFTGSTTAPPKVYVGLDSSICSPEKLLHIDCSCSTPCPSSCTERRGVSFSSEEAQNLQTDLCGLALHNCSESCKIPEKLLTEDTPENLITLEDAKPAPQ
ncbi:hypothetical protein DNTS_021883 [Danionella cerebrum]|uniref:EGF-like domain-containing protein n=1 Tax=Danionella cerebrum TaxID=2873325 RepID=A0A553R5E2_9TELE|nr:hypothetical protein DNTS_021883 [Danionella translucida]